MTRTQTEQDKERQSRRVNGEIELIDARCNRGHATFTDTAIQDAMQGTKKYIREWKWVKVGGAGDDKVENGIENEMDANAMYQCNAVGSGVVLPRRPLLIRLQIQPAHIRVDIVAAPRHRSLVNVLGDRNTRTTAV